MARSKKLSNLMKGTHKGRRARSGRTKHTGLSDPRGVTATGLGAKGMDKRLIQAKMAVIPPTPKGPEPGHGGLEY